MQMAVCMLYMENNSYESLEAFMNTEYNEYNYIFYLSVFFLFRPRRALCSKSNRAFNRIESNRAFNVYSNIRDFCPPCG